MIGVSKNILRGGNPFEEMQDTLKQLGITTRSEKDYNKQFGINLTKKTRVDIEDSHLLIADTPIVKKSALDRTSALIAQAQKNLNLKEGEFTMWLADVPTNTNQPPAIYLASSAVTSQAAAVPHKLGVCQAINSEVEFLSPVSAIQGYQYVSGLTGLEFGLNPDRTWRSDVTEYILQQPKHGRIILDYVDETGYTHLGYRYVPDAGFGDFDYFVMEVKAGDTSVQIYYTMSVGLPGEPNYTYDENNGDRIPDLSRCPDGEIWKISSLSSPLQINFLDLTGAAVGETTGSGANATITLDTNAAGHGWYIGGLTTKDGGQVQRTQNGGQVTELGMLSSVFSQQSSDWLPTSNPNEWVARAGTAAAGKMDMLSVLLHEYGHALGIDHSSDSHDYMATTLTPGMRRLPSSDDMQL